MDNLEEALKYAEENEIIFCEICIYESDCPHGVKIDGGGNPVFPPCTTLEMEDWVDKEVLMNLIKNKEGGEANE